MEKENIPAIFSEDLHDFLFNTSELEKILAGNRFCKICLNPITLQNIQLVVPFRNKPFEYVCNSVSCIENYYE